MPIEIQGIIYPYKVWPCEYGCENIYTLEITKSLADKYKLNPNNDALETFRAALTKAATYYIGYEKYEGKGALTNTGLKKYSSPVLDACATLGKSLEDMPEEIFQALADIYCTDSPNAAADFFGEKEMFDTENQSSYTIKDFYGEHEGFEKLSKSKSQLIQDVKELSKAVTLLPEYFNSRKHTGTNRSGFYGFVDALSDYWQGIGKEPKCYRDTTGSGKGEFLDFLVEAFMYVIPFLKEFYVGTRLPTENECRNYLYSAVKKRDKTIEKIVKLSAKPQSA